MNATDQLLDPNDGITCPDTNYETADHYIADLFDEEGNFGEADCAGL